MSTAVPPLCVGAHVSTAGGLATAAERALAIGAQCVQIFVGAPQQWAEPRYGDDEVQALRAALAEHRIGPLFIHAPYLVNLAALRDDLWARSVQTMVRQLAWANRLDAVGVIVHLGSPGPGDAERAAGPARVAEALRRVLDAHSGSARLILENDAGSGNRLGRQVAELGELLAAARGDPRLGICLDTAHAFEAGYAVTTPDGLAALVGELEQVGAKRLLVVHANDSQTPQGSRRDRHANIGDGEIGAAGLRLLASDPLLRTQPWVLEVPGIKGDGPDAENVARLRALATC
ncbi:MAG: deoxyribonuclease IV [Chloroflexi bacterium]|nr:deoxyribonuclease IV [Chloroflexota bacterium]